MAERVDSTVSRWRAVRVSLVLVLVPAVLLAHVVSVHAYPRPGRTELVSVAPDGASGAGFSTGGLLSADGRYVAFQSDARGLVPEKTTGTTDVFVRDLQTQTTKRVSVSSQGTSPNSSSHAAGISGDGRYVLFTSFASNLVPDDTNAATDTFLHDTITGATSRVSVAADGTQANRASQNSAISSDGRYVAFASRATNLIDGETSDRLHIFVKDLVSGTVELASRSTAGVEGNGTSFFPALSSDGRFIAFHSDSNNLVPNDTNGRDDVFVFDRESGTTERVSLSWNGGEANNSSNRASISADGRFVAFASHATNLVPNGATANIFPFDIYVRDRQRRTTELISASSAGEVGNHGSETPRISPDGRYVVFTSIASNLVRGDNNCPPTITNLARCKDVFVHDRQLVRTERVSLGNGEVEGDGTSSVGSMTPDASTVAFFGSSTNLVPNKTDTDPDVFVRTRGLPLDSVDLRLGSAGNRARVTGGAVFSGGLLSQSPIRQLLIQDSGIEIQQAQLYFHPEEEDLLFRWRLNGVLTMPSPRGPVPFQYLGFSFTTPIGRYEIRIQEHPRLDLPSTRIFATRAELYRCNGDCVHVGDLAGSFGTTGAEARATVPVKTLGLAEGDALTGLRAYAALGHRAAGDTGRVQGVDLPATELPRVEAALAVGSPGASAHDVVFSSVSLARGRFDATLDVPPAPYRVWVRSCFALTCALRPIDVDAPESSPEPTESADPTSSPTVSAEPDPTEDPAPDTTSLTFTERSATGGQHSDEVVLEARLTDSSGDPIAGTEIAFDLVGEASTRSLSATSDENGIGTVRSRLSERPGAYQLTARFAGDDAFTPAADAIAV
ncbi:MAG TPA: hypothetical protein VG929_00045, partial [Actinomycetota bacterium]|nr:hypothetical protein [Actinomycetota bacterium]